MTIYIIDNEEDDKAVFGFLIRNAKGKFTVMSDRKIEVKS